MPSDFKARVIAFAERTMRIKAHCTGEDATRIYLVMPFIELLGYDAGDPSVIVPAAEDAINFAILNGGGEPAIAIEAVGTAEPPNQAHARLRGYCTSHRSVRLGIATNGVVFEAFVDSQQANVLDDEPFMRIDFAEVAAGNIDEQALTFLRMLRAVDYDPEVVAEEAFAFSVRERLKSCVLAEFRNPSEDLCKLLLEQIGIRGARATAIDQHYRPILRTAMEQAIIVPVVQALRRLPGTTADLHVAAITAAPAVPPDMNGHDAPMAEQLHEQVAAFGRLKRRSA